MKKADSMKEMMLIKKLKKEDPIELPMDDQFFDKMHDRIMFAVEKTEVKPLSKWAKTWVFLERKTGKHVAKARKAAKLGLVAVTLALTVSLLSASLKVYIQSQYAHNNMNKSLILDEAQKNPVEWSELVANYQNESDFYAEVLSQRGTETIVEIDKVITQSL